MKIGKLILSVFFASLIMLTSCEDEKDKVKVTGIALSDYELSLTVAETAQLTATIEPEDADEKGVNWTTSDETVATVTGGLVTAISVGTATITATTVDGEHKATCTVVVSSAVIPGTITEIMNKGFLTNANMQSIDIACDASGFPYVANITAHTSDASKGLVQVHKYSGSGTTWNKFSGKDVGVSDDESATPSIAIKDNGTVFVAYEYYDDIEDNRYDNHIVSAYDGTNWLTLGGDGSVNNNCFIMNGSSKLAGETQMAFKQDGTLMLTMVSYGVGYINYFDNGGSWVSLTTGDWTTYNGYTVNNPATFWAGSANIVTDGNKPLVYIRTSSGDSKTGIYQGTETNGENGEWQRLGGYITGAGAEDARFETSLAISSTGEIYTSYQKYESTDCYVYVAHFNQTTSAWENIYTNNVSVYQNEAEVIVSNDVLYLAVAQYDAGIAIYKYDSENNSWSHEGSTPDFGAVYYTIDLAAGNNGEFYIAYSVIDSGSDKEVGVFKYTPAAAE